uniref:Hyccin n=1 Tax=Anthurium amnicola TaxID=1678845 RepID=A0A1D1YLV1_9ARAE
MNRARSSLEKPPLAVSPRRLRPRRGLRSDAAAAPRTPPPAPSPKEDRQLRRSCAAEESPLLIEYEKISRELRDLTKRGEDDFTNADALEAIAFRTHLAGRNSSPLFERGRLYEVYSARRNERLKRKMEYTVEEVPARHFAAADAEMGKRRSTRSVEDVRKSVPENLLVGRAAPSSLRSSLRSSSKETKMSCVLRSAVKYNAQGERRPSVQFNR